MDLDTEGGIEGTLGRTLLLALSMRAYKGIRKEGGMDGESSG